MTNLTAFQNQLISDLQNEFTKLNPIDSNNDRFSIHTVKQSINDLEAFKESVFSFNRIMAEQLKQDCNKQIEKFNQEFSPVKLIHRDTNSMFDNDYYRKNPSNISRAFYFDGETDCNAWRVAVLFDYETVELDLPYEKYKLNKIKGLSWGLTDWFDRNNGNKITYKTLDEFIQANKTFQHWITDEYKKKTK